MSRWGKSWHRLAPLTDDREAHLEPASIGRTWTEQRPSVSLVLLDSCGGLHLIPDMQDDGEQEPICLDDWSTRKEQCQMQFRSRIRDRVRAVRFDAFWLAVQECVQRSVIQHRTNDELHMAPVPCTSRAKDKHEPYRTRKPLTVL